MRTVSYGSACSADGFITGPGDAMDWLHFSTDVEAIMRDYWARVDTVLMGRRTWDFAKAMGGGGSMPGVKTYVFSRTLTDIGAPGVTLVRDDAVEFVRGLKRQRGKEICLMGGSDFAQCLIEADLVDEIGANIHPVLLGQGVPLFRDAGRVALKLTSCRELSGGCVYVMYKVVRSRQ